MAKTKKKSKSSFKAMMDEAQFGKSDKSATHEPRASKKAKKKK